MAREHKFEKRVLVHNKHECHGKLDDKIYVWNLPLCFSYLQYHLFKYADKTVIIWSSTKVK